MKELIVGVLLAVAIAGCLCPRTVVVEKTVEKPVPVPVAVPVRPQPPRAVVVEEIDEYGECEAPVHSLVGDTVKAVTLLVTDVVSIVLPVEPRRKRVLRSRLYDGW